MYSPHLYLKDKTILVPMVGSVLLMAAMWWYVVSRISPTNDAIFLHYNTIFGIDLVGEWWKIFFAPVIGVGVFLVNYFLSFAFYATNKLPSRFFSFFTLFFEALLLVGVVLIVRLNI